MRPSIRLGKIFGIEIGLHYSWFLIAALAVFSLSAHFHLVNPQWSLGLTWLLALVTAVLFFGSIVAHELSHAAVGNARGLPVKMITLFALGGVASAEKEADNPKSEFWMAIAGPITSLVLGLLFLGICRTAGWNLESGTPASPVGAGLLWLGYINIALAIFNMIPGYPLDGGRVLRSIIWAINKNRSGATRIAAGVGQMVAVAFILLGFFRFFATGAFGGLWMAFIGWFLADAAAASRANVEVSDALTDARVGDVMSEGCPVVDGKLNLRTLAENYLLRTGRDCFVVEENGYQLGLVTANELRKIGRERWPFKTAADIARPFDQTHAVSPDDSLIKALEFMAREGVNQLPVLANGRLVGIVNRGHVQQYMQNRQELKAA